MFVEKLGDQHIAIGAPHIFYSPLESQRIRYVHLCSAIHNSSHCSRAQERGDVGGTRGGASEGGADVPHAGRTSGPPAAAARGARRRAEWLAASRRSFAYASSVHASRSHRRSPAASVRESPWVEALRTATLTVRVKLSATFELLASRPKSSRAARPAAVPQSPPLDNVVLAARQ